MLCTRFRYQLISICSPLVGDRSFPLLMDQQPFDTHTHTGINTKQNTSVQDFKLTGSLFYSLMALKEKTDCAKVECLLGTLHSSLICSERGCYVCFQGRALLVARSEQGDAACRPVPSSRGDVCRRSLRTRHQPSAQTLLHPHWTRRHGPSQELGTCRSHRQVNNTQ